MDFKTRHYALRTPDGYLGMDARTKQLEIYEDWQSAVDNCQGCDVVAVEVYDQRQKSVIDEMNEMLSKLDVYDGSSGSVALQDEIDNILAKVRGEDSNPSTLHSEKQGD